MIDGGVYAGKRLSVLMFGSSIPLVITNSDF